MNPADTEDPRPCDGCALYQRCASARPEIACLDYADWARTGAARTGHREPSELLYAHAMELPHDGAPTDTPVMRVRVLHALCADALEPFDFGDSPNIGTAYRYYRWLWKRSGKFLTAAAFAALIEPLGLKVARQSLDKWRVRIRERELATAELGQ